MLSTRVQAHCRREITHEDTSGKYNEISPVSIIEAALNTCVSVFQVIARILSWNLTTIHRHRRVGGNPVRIVVTEEQAKASVPYHTGTVIADKLLGAKRIQSI